MGKGKGESCERKGLSFAAMNPQQHSESAITLADLEETASDVSIEEYLAEVEEIARRTSSFTLDLIGDEEPTLKELQRAGAKLLERLDLYWPQDIYEAAKEKSAGKVLKESWHQYAKVMEQLPSEKSITSLDDFFTQLESARKEQGLGPSLFIKHTLVSSGIGKEKLGKVISGELDNAFEDKKVNVVLPNGKKLVWDIPQALLDSTTKSTKLYCDTGKMMKEDPEKDLTNAQKMVTMLIFFGKYIKDAQLPHEVKDLGTNFYYTGNTVNNFKTFYSAHNIDRSSIVRQEIANSQGKSFENLMQEKVKTRLEEEFETLGLDWEVRKSEYKGVGGDKCGHDDCDNGKTCDCTDLICDNVWDIVKDDKVLMTAGIEVSFQETGNSTIERKANSAKDWFDKSQKNKESLYFICGGIGWKQRSNAFVKLFTGSRGRVYKQDERGLEILSYQVIKDTLDANPQEFEKVKDAIGSL